MLAAILTNQPYTVPSSGDHYRRPGEKVVWHDDWLKAQEELTKFKALPEEEQEEIVEEAVQAVTEAETDIEQVADAQDAIQGVDVSEILRLIEELDVLMVGYFMLEMQRKRNIAAMLVLGIL